jgi:hypothetical protein
MLVGKVGAGAVLAVGLAVGGGVRPALAQGDERPIEAPATAQAGDEVVVQGGGCTGDFGVATVSAETGAVVLSGRVPVADDGGWTAALTFPADTPPGQYVVAVVCLQGTEPVFSYEPQTITISAAGSGAADPQLPATGGTGAQAETPPLAGTGVGAAFLVVVGLAMIALGSLMYRLSWRGAVIPAGWRPRPRS